MRADEIRALSLFDGLTDDQLAELMAGSTVVWVEPGPTCSARVSTRTCWWVLIDGALDLVRRVGGEDTVVGKMDVPGRWAGGFRAWDEHGVYLATGPGVGPRPAAAGCRPRCCVSGSTPGSRSAGTSIEGLYQHRTFH